MQTAIGVFDSRDRAEGALKELLRHNVPQESIVFLTRSENEAVAVARELGASAGTFVRSVEVTTTLLAVPGLGPVLAVSIGATVPLWLAGGPKSNAIGKAVPEDASSPERTPDDIDAALFRKLLKDGRSLVLARTPWHEIASAACTILGRFGVGTPERTGVKMQIGTRHVNGITVLDLKGKIHIGEGAVMLRETITDLAAKGHKRILLNLNEVESVDSSGIGEFVRIHTTLRKLRGQLKLANLYTTLEDILHMTCLHTVLDIQKDEASAIRSFGRLASANA